MLKKVHNKIVAVVISRIRTGNHGTDRDPLFSFYTLMYYFNHKTCVDYT